MTEKEHVYYLANLVTLITIDNVVDRKEKIVLDYIQNELEIGPSYLEDAIKLVKNGLYEVFYFDRFSLNIRNLEDLVLLAHCDEKYKLTELSIIENFRQKLKLTNEQFEMIEREAKGRLRKINENSIL